MPLLPVTWTPPGQLSRRRLAALALVGANKQVGQSVDRDPVFFLRPGQVGIVGPKSRLDMGQRDARLARRQRAAERARRVALDDEQIGRVHRQQPLERRPDQVGMEHRVGLTRAAERNRLRKPSQAMIGQLKARMLAGNEQPAAARRGRRGRGQPG